ncbi:MAG: cation diffusion facilitator family transporter [Eubacteriales bacterium]|nr:cation diffusion facilitator family transporter [Eubacteriales bacterium]
MLKLLIKLFIKNPEDVSDQKVRNAYGTLCGAFGIFLNILLFAGKYFAGIISGSVAISADAFNNLSDAGSSLISLLGFRLASRRPDPDHPFGHGRVEYLTGLVISALIILMGFELGKTSVGKIINPTPIEGGVLPMIILLVSIAVKFYMSSYNRVIGKKISSSSMLATATDSLSDSISTAVVFVSMLISKIFGLNIDGWAGLAVAVFIFFAGFSAIKDTIAPLLGTAPEKEFVSNVEKAVMAHPEVLGIHDLIVHDYGPGRLFISLHAEVDGNGNVFDLHDVIDNAENDLREKFGCLATIHLDPIDPGNSELFSLKTEITRDVQACIGDESITIHDLRMVPGPSHTNVIFDAVLPADCKMTDAEAASLIRKSILKDHPGYFAVINIDRSFV